MSGLTGLWKKPTPKEQARSAQRDLRGNTRELDRELLQLKREEEALVKARARAGGGGCVWLNLLGARPTHSAPPTHSLHPPHQEIKSAANKGNMAGARILAQQLVRLRGQQTKLLKARATLQGVSVSVATAATTATVGQSLGAAGKAMAAVGAAAPPAKVQAAVGAFARESERMGMASEIMDDALEGAMDGEGFEDETDEVVGQVQQGGCGGGMHARDWCVRA